MARLLYRLGRFSARRAWLVISVWAVLLAGMAGVALATGPAKVADMAIPGTEFQTVVDDLKEAMPDAAGGSAAVVFSTADQAGFTPEQEQAVAHLIDSWRTLDGVVDVINPFTSQADLDDANEEVADGRQELDEAKEKIRTNTEKLADARQEIADGRDTIAANTRKLKDGQAELNAAQKKLDDGRSDLAQGARKLEAGSATLSTNEEKLADGQEQLDAAKAKLTAGKQQLTAAQGQLTTGLDQLDQAIAALRAQIEAAEAVPGPAPASAPTDPDPAATAQPDSSDASTSPEPVADASPEAADAGLDAAREQLAQLEAQRAELQAQLSALEEQSAELDAGEQTLAEKQAELDAGKEQLGAARDKLDAGAAELAAGRKKLAAGQATIDKNQAKIDDGFDKLAAGTRKLDKAEADVADGEKKIADALTKVTDGEVDLARGERTLALTEGFRLVSADGSVALAQIQFAESLTSLTTATKNALPQQAAALTAYGVNVDFADDLTNRSESGQSEAVGIAIAGVVLLVMFGALLAAGLPLLTSLIGVGIGILGATALGALIPMAEVTPVLAVMLGLAVGIDYALFIVNRHRKQLKQGIGLRESIGLATGTAGGAVLFAGMTVVVALAALVLTRIPWLGLMGLVAAGTVAIAVLVSLTLTPALLSLIGPRVLSRKDRAALATGPTETERATSVAATAPRRGWGALVTRHPVAATAATVLVLGIIAVPATTLKLGLPDGSQASHDSTGYRTYSLIEDGFGPGQNGPIVAVASVDPAVADSLDADAVTDLELDVAEQLRATPGVSYVLPADHSDDNRTLIFQIVPTTGPSDDATADLVHTLRTNRTAIIDQTPIDSIGFAGQTVANIDITQRLAEVMPGYLVVVIGISLVLLLLVFRSLLVPLIATAGFLLSIAAAFGAVVAVYQWGWFGAIFGVETPSPILAFLPILAIGILFGLAMDYQMFLVSGMREAHSHGQDARTAVRTGFVGGARVITAAALIMTAVFASFMFSEIALIRPIGFILTVGVLFDAFVVRMTLMPALMHLLGAKAWYLPKWLDQVLPRVDVEGTSLARLKGTATRTSDATDQDDLPAVA